MPPNVETEVYCYRPDLEVAVPGSTVCRAERVDAFRRIREVSDAASDPVDLAFAAAVRGKIGFLDYVMRFKGLRVALYAIIAILGVGIIGEAFWALRTHFLAAMAGLIFLALAIPFAVERYGSYSLWVDVHGTRVVAFGHEAMYIADRRGDEVIRVPLEDVSHTHAERTRDLERAEIRDDQGKSLVLIERLPFTGRPGKKTDMVAVPTVLDRIDAAHA